MEERSIKDQEKKLVYPREQVYSCEIDSAGTWLPLRLRSSHTECVLCSIVSGAFPIRLGNG